MLSSETIVIAETWDSWFNCQKLKLPQGCGYEYEFQMQYGSTGWSVGAMHMVQLIREGLLALVMATSRLRLKMCQQCWDVGKIPSSFFLINNCGYTIEVEIHDGPYNVIENWNYTGLVDAIHNGESKYRDTKVFCEEDLIEAIEIAEGD
ncbi:pyruvate decarboxylase 2-like [Rutidosis leptorrhynchoides]|uniref:pyruvate decarboxylase 2-like n=1 Tax=Rutidosis leptorrhynchoides TaxID=125765 RepID=UPI003A98DA89